MAIGTVVDILMGNAFCLVVTGVCMCVYDLFCFSLGGKNCSCILYLPVIWVVPFF